MSEKTEGINDKAGFVYIFASPSIKGWVKVGVATRKEGWRGRLKNYQTYAPDGFYPVATLKTADCRGVERYLLKAIGTRVQKKREFLRLSPDAAATHLRDIAELTKELAGFERHDKGGGTIGTGKAGAKADAPQKSLKGITFHATKKGSEVFVKVNGPDRYTVLKGSKLMPMNQFLKTADTDCAISIRKARAAVESDSATVKDGVLLRDVDFGSSSRALAVMLGTSSMSGPGCLLDKDGKPLKDYLAQG